MKTACRVTYTSIMPLTYEIIDERLSTRLKLLSKRNNVVYLAFHYPTQLSMLKFSNNISNNIFKHLAFHYEKVFKQYGPLSFP